MNAQPSTPGAEPGRFVPALRQATLAYGIPTQQDREFIDLLNGYRPYRGLAKMSALPKSKRVLCNGQDSLVEDLVFCGDVFAFPWQDAMWIPMFQFDMSGLAVESGPQSVASTLGLGFNGWAIASWFVEPCSWLGDHRPIECLGSRLSEVLYAARANGDSTYDNLKPTPLDTNRYQ